MIKKMLTAAIIAGSVSMASAGPAFADHEHYVVREDRNGETECRYIAQGQTDKDGGDPGGHKFHENVHAGQPGSDEHGTDFDRDIHEEDRCNNVEEKDSKAQRP